MNPKNVREIRKKTAAFTLSFCVLTFFTFLTIFASVKSYSRQQDFIAQDINNYRQVLNKEFVLHERVDSLYNLMDLLGSGKVENDLFLEKYIADYKDDLVKAIGTDSLTEFKHYYFLTNKLNDMLSLKDSIRQVSDREALAQRDLLECMNKTRKIKRDLSVDPTRNFSLIR